MSLDKFYASIRTGRADDALVKVVVPSQRLIWLWVPKNAGGSIARTLVNTHGEDAVPCDLPLERLWRLNPEMRNFRIVGFKRNPFTRIVSCWLNKIAEPRSFKPHYLEKYPGLRPGMPFSEFAAWLNTDLGNDENADPHWQSQHLQLERATEVLAFENLPRVVKRLGLKPGQLPHKNPHSYAAEIAGLDDRPLLDWYDAASVGEISRRYARDLERLRYDIPEELLNLAPAVVPKPVLERST